MDKTTTLQIRLSEHQKKEIKYLAKKEGFNSISSYIRNLSTKDKLKERKVLRELHKRLGLVRESE
tara:strand:+ start:442 stop:636 length:195 start_codon:yes stop_codon:yes gene_type:complete